MLELLAQRYTLGALTNGNADIYKTDAAQYFDFAFSAEDMGASKPHPAMFQAALKKPALPLSILFTSVMTLSMISVALATSACIPCG